MNDAEFYELESFREQLEFLLQYIDADRKHFHFVAEGIEVLPGFAVDPIDREGWLTVGAEIANLRVAAAHFGFGTTVMHNADATVIAFHETCHTDEDLRRLFPAIKKRHTSLKRFRDEPLEPEVVQHVCDFVDRHPETLRLVLQRDYERVGELVAHADPSRRDAKLVDNAAALVVITAEDDRVALIAAGETLEQLLLQLTLDGLDYSFISGVVRSDSLRERVWSLLGACRPPQLLLRVGHAKSGVFA